MSRSVPSGWTVVGSKRGWGLLTVTSALLALSLAGCPRRPVEVARPAGSETRADELQLRGLLVGHIPGSAELQRLLRGPDRAIVLREIGRAVEPVPAELLRAALGDPSPGVREAAAFALGRSEEDPVPELATLALEDDLAVATAALRALARQGVAPSDLTDLVRDGEGVLPPRILAAFDAFEAETACFWLRRRVAEGSLRFADSDSEAQSGSFGVFVTTWGDRIPFSHLLLAAVEVCFEAGSGLGATLESVLEDPRLEELPGARARATVLWLRNRHPASGDGATVVAVPTDHFQSWETFERARVWNEIGDRLRGSPGARGDRSLTGQLLADLGSSDRGLAASAASAARGWGLESSVVDELRTLAGGSGEPAEAAIRALVGIGDPETLELLPFWLRSARPEMRRRAATLLWRDRDEALLAVLSTDRSPRVREAVLMTARFRARASSSGSELDRTARAALEDGDTATRELGVRWWRERPAPSLRPRVERLASGGHGVPRLGVVAALAVGEPIERWLWRPRLQGPISGSLFARSIARLHTSAGDIDVELLCDRTPRACDAFFRYVGGGAYGGAELAEWKPGQTVGWRAERARFTWPLTRPEVGERIAPAGAVIFVPLPGAAEAGVADVDFEILLEPQVRQLEPFGRVLAGWQALTALREGDRILSVDRVTASVPASRR